MSEQKKLVLDANILIRAVLGRKARHLIKQYHDKVRFYAPDVCFLDAQRHLPNLLHTDEIDSGLDLLNEIARVVEVVDRVLYEKYEYGARERVARRESRRLAGGSDSYASGLCHLDGRPGFFWRWHSDLDQRSSRNVPARKLVMAEALP